VSRSARVDPETGVAVSIISVYDVNSTYTVFKNPDSGTPTRLAP